MIRVAAQLAPARQPAQPCGDRARQRRAAQARPTRGPRAAWGAAALCPPAPNPACCNQCASNRVCLHVCTDCPAALARNVDGAFGTLVAHHQDLVFGVARRVTKNPHDAEDLAQEAFLRAYRALGGYEKSRIRDLRLRGWLAQITLNLGRNHARDVGPATAELDATIDPADPARDRPESVAERREAARYWQTLISELPPRLRRAVELRHVAGLSYGELAEALERPVGTVKSDVHRGTRLLRAAHERERERDARLMEVAR